MKSFLLYAGSIGIYTAFLSANCLTGCASHTNDGVYTHYTHLDQNLIQTLNDSQIPPETK